MAEMREAPSLLDAAKAALELMKVMAGEEGSEELTAAEAARLWNAVSSQLEAAIAGAAA